MQRRNFLRFTGLTAASFALLGQSSLAAFLTDPAWKIRMLTDTIGVFTEKGGTIAFLLSNDGIVVVDAQFPDSAGHLIEELKKKTEKTFNFLINTHHHGDHTAGNIAFKDLVSHVIAHENSKANQVRVAKEKNQQDNQLYPDMTFDANGWMKGFGKEKIQTYYFGAGHTNGDCLVHFQNAGIVHMGDLVFNRRHPYIDKTAGADIGNWIKLLDTTIAAFDPQTQYVCGHAGEGYDIVLNKTDLKAYRNYLDNLMKFVRQEIKAGKTKEDILKAREIPGSPEWKGDGIERPLTAAWQELAT